jgi:hypothetical protein
VPAGCSALRAAHATPSTRQYTAALPLHKHATPGHVIAAAALHGMPCYCAPTQWLEALQHYNHCVQTALVPKCSRAQLRYSCSILYQYQHCHEGLSGAASGNTGRTYLHASSCILAIVTACATCRLPASSASGATVTMQCRTTHLKPPRMCGQAQTHCEHRIPVDYADLATAHTRVPPRFGDRGACLPVC